MKSKNVKDLEAAMYEWKRIKYPNTPAHAIPKPTYSDADANGLTRCIVDFVNLQPHCYAWRSSNAPTFDHATGQHRAGNVTKGVSDIAAIRAGRAWMIEVKHGKDRVSEHQREFAARVDAAGGVYCVARTFDGFVAEWGRALGNDAPGDQLAMMFEQLGATVVTVPHHADKSPSNAI